MAHGKICYIEMPTSDVARSAKFYSTIFGWTTRARGDGAMAFDDSTGAVSGTWLTSRKPVKDPGALTYIMVDSIDDTVRKIAAGGGRIVTPKTAISDGGNYYATFTDPTGNLFGLYQEIPKK
jgi:predicted enzyme related to lactoylglutathione lyase